MAINKKYGKPDLFITFTCNPKWPEITENLYPGQTANDRPDLVTRVFKLKLNKLLNDIFKHGVLGKVVTHVQVIDFQKRGLPHTHILLHLANDDKLETAQDINNLICAEFPHPVVNRELYDVIKTCMIHGPCEILNPNSPCIKDGVCTKSYPKEFNTNTVAVHNGYPQYRRRDNGLVINIKGNNVDNRWVIPYNPWLSKKYQVHINAEACMSVKAVKYLYNCIYKGHDCANVLINEQVNHNEIVYFREGEEQVAFDRAAQRETHLTVWFKLNSENEGAHRYSFVDISYHFVFDDKHYKWKANGATSWADLRTVNGIVLETFRKACVLKGLLQDDTEWQNTLSEAVLTRMPKQIRQLFSVILTFCEPYDPLHLWNTYKAFIMEDFIHRQVPFILAEQATLRQIEKIINQSGKTLSDYNLPQSIDEANRIRPLLNVNQLNVSNAVLAALNEQPSVENQHSRLFFIGGPAGSGKTFTYNYLVAETKSRGFKSATAAWTGIAATLLTNGSTLHGLFKLPVPILDNTTCNVTPNSIHGHFLKQLAPSDSNLPFVLKRRQFPVRLAYSMTINKSQGQTFDRVKDIGCGVNIPLLCFIVVMFCVDRLLGLPSHCIVNLFVLGNRFYSYIFDKCLY
ncbi:uncharacterized protein LOC136091069 [Hydra vulgaris]|uniref:ATP-dependent DNA helicase n=1 Tax=Hydra vulgaris TaxID=6087 RepID=A0ABM4DHZ9_HYDVU